MTKPLSYDTCFRKAVRLSSRDFPTWPDGVVVNSDDFQPFEQDSAEFAEDHLCINLGEPAHLRYTPRGESAHDGPVRPGGGLLCPAGLEVGWALRTPTRAMSIRYRPGFLRKFGEHEKIDPALIELRYAAPLYDPILQSHCELLRGLLQSEGGCPLTAQMSITSLTIYLLRERVTRPLPPVRRTPSATDGSVRRAKQLIEERFCDPELDIDLLAAELGMSRRQFYRLFERTELKSPWKYVIRLRVERAAVLLIEHRHWPEQTIAAEVGFATARQLDNHFKFRFKKCMAEFRANHR